MVLGKFLSPPDLTKTKLFYIYELTQIIIVSKDQKLIFTTFQVLLPNLKNLNNDQQLFIIRFVASFSEDCFLREKSHWILLTNFRLGRNWIFVGYMIGKILIRSHVTQDPINIIPQSISLNLYIIFQTKMPRN